MNHTVIGTANRDRMIRSFLHGVARHLRGPGALALGVALRGAIGGLVTSSRGLGRPLSATDPAHGLGSRPSNPADRPSSQSPGI